MQKEWNEPSLTTLSVNNTYDVSNSYAGRVRCKTCGLVFESGAQFNGHLVGSPTDGKHPLSGKECPKGNLTDSLLTDSAELLS